MQPARTVPAGHLQISAALQGTPPVGMAGVALDTVEAIDDIDSRTSPARIQELAEDAVAGLVAPPSVDAHLGIAYGVSRRFELDARIGPTGAGAGFRVQVLRKSPGIYLAIGAMLSFQYRDFELDRFTDEGRILNMRRMDLRVPISFGYSSSSIHVWGGPVFVHSRFSTDLNFCVRSRGGECQSEAEVMASGSANHLAGQFGLAVGKGRVWVAAELTVGRVWVNGNAELSMPRTTQTTAFSRSGTILQPALGLLTWF